MAEPSTLRRCFQATRRLAAGLSGRLLVLSILFVLLAEVLIYTPSIARFRMTWLDQRLGEAHLALLAARSAGQAELPDSFKYRLLDSVDAYAVGLRSNGGARRMIGKAEVPAIDARFDRRDDSWHSLIAEAFATLGQGGNRVIAITGPSPRNAEVRVRAVVDEAPLRRAMLGYSGRILGLSVAISLITAGLVFIAIRGLMVRPLTRLTRATVAFRADPSSAPVITDSGRRDEIGTLECELAELQDTVRQALNQQRRLADLGAAVTKINHDLRGMLANASLLSERLVASDDPEMRRIGPRLLDSLDRASRLCARTLEYSREGPPTLRRSEAALAELVEDAVALAVESESAGEGDRAPELANRVPARITVQADRDQLTRALTNLVRNAAQAGSGRIAVTAQTGSDGGLTISVADDGPGLPPRARENLFRPFAASTRKDGSGLGLAIAREIAVAHGGDLVLAESTGQGTRFDLTLPPVA